MVAWAAAAGAAAGGGAREERDGGDGTRGGHASQDTQSVFYVKAGNEAQYKILPVQMTVLIDQDHVQDLLIELENSPMAIEVRDFELQRPTAK